MDVRGSGEALRALVLEDVAPLSCVKAMAMVGINACAGAIGSAYGQIQDILRAAAMPEACAHIHLLASTRDVTRPAGGC